MEGTGGAGAGWTGRGRRLGGGVGTTGEAR